MLKKFFILFASCLALVLILGSIFINAITNHTVVEFWILLMLPSFGVPILTAVMFSKSDEQLV